jgi:hypothetical protein
MDDYRFALLRGIRNGLPVSLALWALIALCIWGCTDPCDLSALADGGNDGRAQCEASR